MAEVSTVFREVEYIIRVTSTEFNTILAALAVANINPPDKYRGLDYYGLRENLLKGK